MAITVVSSNSNSEESTTCSVTIPSTTVNANDLIVCFYAEGNDVAPTTDPPTGYTAICDEHRSSGGRDNAHRSYYKVAVGGEEDDVISFATSAAAPMCMGVIVLRGVDVGGDIFDITIDHDTQHLRTLDDPNPTLANITTSTNGAWVFEITTIPNWDDAVTNIASDNGSATEWVNLIETAGGLGCCCLATYYEKATAGSHTGATHTYTGGNAADESISHIFAVKPSEAAGASAKTPMAHFYRQLQGVG